MQVAGCKGQGVAAEALPAPQPTQEPLARLRLERALRNRLAEEEFRQWN